MRISDWSSDVCSSDLFGTVWGIMSAFISIGNVKQAALATVAPGIAEALIATAMGLVAAIPAVIASNFFTRGVDRLDSRFQVFRSEERRVGKECVSTCRSRWSPIHLKKKRHESN